MAECRRIDPNHVGPHCGCFGDACALDAPRPTSELAADVPAIARRWHTYHGRGAHDYTDAGCRILAEHAFRDVPALVARVTDLEARNATRGQALAAICQGNDRGYWIDIYREAGGGYEGLQAIASHALAATREGE